MINILYFKYKMDIQELSLIPKEDKMLKLMKYLMN